MKHTIALVLSVAAAAWMLAGCGGSHSSSPDPVKTSWTVLVYMNAANDLEPDSFDDVNEMEQIRYPSNVNVIVQWKRSGRYDSRLSWTGTRRYKVLYHPLSTEIGSELLQNMGSSVDMGNPSTLREFIAWGRANYPADRYAVVIWNHGAGWRQPVEMGGTRGVSYDDVTGNHIRTWDLAGALRPTLDTPRLDLVVFDASLMQMMEVAYEIRNTADYIVGSQESPPAAGYPYHRILAPLASNPGMGASSWARSIVQQTVNYYTIDSPKDNITQSAIDASRLDALAYEVDNLASIALDSGISASAATTARDNARTYANSNYKDMLDYAERLARAAPGARIESAVMSLRAAMNTAVIEEGHASQRNGSNGLSIYVPRPAQYENNYGLLAFARATRWPDWINKQGP